MFLYVNDRNLADNKYIKDPEHEDTDPHSMNVFN